MSSRLQLDVHHLTLWRRHLVNAYEVKAGTGVIADKTVWSMPEPLACTIQNERYINTFTFYPWYEILDKTGAISLNWALIRTTNWQSVRLSRESGCTWSLENSATVTMTPIDLTSSETDPRGICWCTLAASGKKTDLLRSLNLSTKSNK